MIDTAASKRLTTICLLGCAISCSFGTDHIDELYSPGNKPRPQITEIRERPPVLPRRAEDPRPISGAATRPVSQLTYGELADWTFASGLSAQEFRQRKIFRDALVGSAFLLRDDIVRPIANLDLSTLSALTSLPENLHIRGTLLMEGLHQLCHLPAGLTIGEDLIVLNCDHLSSVPKDLVLNGSLILENCRSLSALPEGLHVKLHLVLSGCRNLTALPQRLQVGGHLILNGCSSIEALPSDLATWGPSSDGSMRMVELTGSGVSEATIAQLQAAHAWGIQVNSSADRPLVPPSGFASVQEAYAFWRKHAPSGAAETNSPLWEPSGAQRYHLLSFLQRLQETADFCSMLNRPNLATRVLTLLELLDQAEALRDPFIEIMEHALVSCSDRVMLAMNQLEQLKRLHRIEADGQSESDLRDLGLAMMKLEIVHKHVQLKIQAQRAAAAQPDEVDDIEVQLAFETRLREPLDLPIAARSMAFEGLAMVTVEDIRRASDEAKRAANNAEQVEAYLRAWAPWQHHIRKQLASSFDWSRLPTRVLPEGLDKNQVCPITQIPLGELDDLVLFQRNGAWLGCSAEGLLSWWTKNGTDPIWGSQMALTDLYRAEEMAPAAPCGPLPLCRPILETKPKMAERPADQQAVARATASWLAPTPLGS